jgi:hypothetical protein
VAGKGGAETGSGALRSVDPQAEPYVDIVDHILNRARNGPAIDPKNLDTKTWEANSRKAGFERREDRRPRC